MKKLLAVILLALASHAQAVVYYVATDGNNSNNGTTLGTPFQTVGRATGVANPGDVINVRAGTYNERIIIGRAGTAVDRITLRGYQKERPVIRSAGAGPTIYFYTQLCEDAAAAELSGNVDCEPLYWTVTGLEVQGSATGGGDGNAIKIDTPKVKIIGNKLGYTVADVVKVVRTANDTEIIDNEILQNASITVPSINAQGVDIVGTDRVIVRGNYIHDVPDFGIYAKGNARNPLFENNLLVNIGNAGGGTALMCGQETDVELLLDGNYESYDCVIRNNVVVNSTWACVAISSSFNATVAFNSCYNTGSAVHGSIFVSNESIIGQQNTGVTIRNNILAGNPANSQIKLVANAFTNNTTLTVDKNIYWTSTGAAPSFTADDNSGPGNFATWLSDYGDLTSKTDTSVVANPMFRTTAPGWNALSLLGTSPAINAATVMAGYSKDFRQMTRGSTPDIGAWEYVGSTPFDRTAPYLTSMIPVSDATSIPATAQISMTFTEAVDCSTVSTKTVKLTAPGNVAGSVSCTGNTATFTPTAQMAYSTVHKVALGGAIRDLSGNRLKGVKSWSFTTAGTPATGDTFNFIVYGDSRPGNNCEGNQIHMGLLNQMAAEPAELAIHVGDMIAGLYNTANWISRGTCTSNADNGSFQQMIVPLASKTPQAGLPYFFFPVVGNHDDNWYPDPYGNGFCDVFNPQLLVTNHTQEASYLDTIHPEFKMTNAEFFAQACSLDPSGVYSTYMYYTFKHKNTRFVILKLNGDYEDLMECNTCSGQLANYDHYYRKHQLDWLRATLDAAQADATVQNVFVFMHAPLVTLAEHPATTSWTTLLPDLSARSKVKAAFSGHNHVYERSHPIASTLGNPTGVRNDSTGVVYFTTGGGGSPLHGFSGTDTRQAYQNSTYHYMKVEVNGATITTKAINQSGTIIDQTTLPVR